MARQGMRILQEHTAWRLIRSVRTVIRPHVGLLAAGDVQLRHSEYKGTRYSAPNAPSANNTAQMRADGLQKRKPTIATLLKPAAQRCQQLSQENGPGITGAKHRSRGSRSLIGLAAVQRSSLGKIGPAGSSAAARQVDSLQRASAVLSGRTGQRKQ